MISVLVLSTFLILSATSSTDDDGRTDDNIIDIVDGDILVGFVIDGKLFSYAVQNLLSFKAAVTDSTFWPTNGRVGYAVFYFPRLPEESYIDRLLKMLHKYPKIVALVGFRRAVSVLQSASLVSAIKIPSFTLGSSIRMDELLNVENNDFMTRITSTRSRQVTHTIPSILHNLGVNIVSIFYESGKEPEFTKLIQVLDLGNKKVDVEHHLLLNGTSDSKHVENHLLDKHGHSEAEKHRFRTVVLLLYGLTLEKLLHDLRTVKGLSDIIFITDSSGCKSSLKFSSAVEDLTTNNVFIFRLCQTRFVAPEVMSYIESYKLYTQQNGQIEHSSKVIDHWYSVENGLEPCIIGENVGCISVAQVCLGNTPPSRYNHRIYYTVRKLLKSLENITEEQIAEISKRTFNNLLINTSSVGDMARQGFLENNVPLPEDTTFLRYTNGSMEDDYEVLFDAKGAFGRKVTIWTSGNNNTRFDNFMRQVKFDISGTTDEQHFACSIACTEGNKTVLDRRFLNCWTCVPCGGNSYTENGSLASCKECNSSNTSLWVNEKKTACDQPAGSVNFNTNSGKAIWIIASLNIAVLIVTIVIYIKYWKSRVIISSGRDLSCVMFGGILIGHIESLLIAMEPTSTNCILIQVFSHFFIMLTVCPLLVKTFRIWMVFKFSIKLGRRLKNYVNNWVTMSECLVLMVPQLVFLLLGLLLLDDNDSYNYKFTINYEEESLESPIVVTKSCGPLNFTLMLISIVYAGILLLVSSVLGWDCRKLPDNFKESMHIFLSSLISLLLIAVYVPAMLTMAGFTQVSLLAGVITIISVTLNLVIFMPKVYVVLFVPPIKQKKMFKSTVTGGNSHKSTVSEPVSCDM